MEGLDGYRSFGLALAAFGLASALYVYLVLGPVPLVAAFMGASIVGASMYLTPPAAPAGSRQLVAILENTLANLSALLEALRVGTANLFVDHGGQAYIYLSPRPLEEVPREPPASAITATGGGPLIVLRAPISRDMLGEVEDPCAAIDHILVDVLDVADRVTCVDNGDELVVRVVGLPASEPSRLARALGGLHGTVAGAVAALLKGPVTLSAEDRPGERVIRIRAHG